MAIVMKNNPIFRFGCVTKMSRVTFFPLLFCLIILLSLVDPAFGETGSGGADDVPAVENGCKSVSDMEVCLSYDNCIWKYGGKCRYSEVSRSRVIFIGNSFTIRNKMVDMFYGIARKAGENPLVVQKAVPSTLLQQHINYPSVNELIKSRNDWKAVILQEQSQQLANPKSRYEKVTMPALYRFQNLIDGHSESMILFMTWGYYYNYQWMQQALINGYEDAARTIGSTKNCTTKVSPVGYAWRLAFEEYGIKLYVSDGRHPSRLGSYLASLVHYATVYNKSPLHNKYKPKRIDKSDAKRMRYFADKAFKEHVLVIDRP